jgi:hypothetical protein
VEQKEGQKKRKTIVVLVKERTKKNVVLVKGGTKTNYK